MLADISAVQRELVVAGVDGWLLYDFHGSNPIAARLVGLEGAHTTRRWYYFIPPSGTPTKLVHAIEPRVLDQMPGEVRLYAGREALEAGLRSLIGSCTVVAMEFSADCAIPYISRVDAGTVDLIRRLGPRVVSSGDLVGRFEAAWDETEIAMHRTASEKIHRIKDQAFAYAGAQLAAGRHPTEYEIQQQMMQWFRHEGLVTDAPPMVAVAEHAGDPHYTPSPSGSRPLGAGELLLLDLWGKLDQPGAVYADITWTGIAGEPTDEIRRVFDIVAAARDAALDRVVSAIESGTRVRGCDVDRASRDVITSAGYGPRFVHRTGHSLGTEVHGNGVHMDDYETHDDRQLLAGTGFTIEPGIYLATFGIRSEINVVVGHRTAEVTGPCQRDLVQLRTMDS
jgi:Xaa-Pro aminopeptidase